MRLWSLTALGILSLSACAQSPTPQTEPSPTPTGDNLAHFIAVFDDDQSSVDRFYSVRWSPTRFDRQEALIVEWRSALGEIDFDSLSQEGKVDWLLMRDYLDAETARLALTRQRLAEIDAVLPFRKAISDLEEARWRGGDTEWEAAAAIVSAIPGQIKSVRERIEAGRKPDAEGAGDALTVSQVMARRAAGATGSLRWSLTTWFDFYDGYVPAFSWWLKKPYQDAVAALDDYGRFLREEIAGQRGNDDDPLVGDPIGSDALLADLRAEFIPYSPEELIAIGEREFAWCEAQMKIASAEMGFGDDWKAALAAVKADHVGPGEQPAFAASQVQAGIDFMKDNNLITIPPLAEETWRTTMISPETQKVLPFAAYGDQAMMIAYPTDTMKHDDKLMSMRGNNRHFTRIVAPHEMIPGHHLQGYMASRYRSDRQLFRTPFFVEGWCLYWEMVLWDMGYGQSPEDRIGMLFWRMHRCARIVVSLKFHLGTMSPQQMIDYLVDRVGHERMGATSEVRRYINGDYSPLYQCGYMIGGLQIRAMRVEAVDSGRMSAKEFHDAQMKMGAIPVELIRAQLLGTPLTRETEPSWRFGDPLP